LETRFKCKTEPVSGDDFFELHNEIYGASVGGERNEAKVTLKGNSFGVEKMRSKLPKKSVWMLKLRINFESPFPTRISPTVQRLLSRPVLHFSSPNRGVKKSEMVKVGNFRHERQLA